MNEKMVVDQEQHGQSSFSFLRWWYALSAPAQPSPDAPLALRERARRGQLASTILLILLLIVVAFLILALFTPNRIALLSMALTFAFVCFAVFLNRIGLTSVAGIMMIVVLDVGIANIFLSNPDGLSIKALPIYDMFLLSQLFAVSFLTPVSVLFVAVSNCIFIFLDVTLQRPAPDLAAILATSRNEIMLGPISLQLIIAVVLFLWVQSALRAIARADRAEEIAALREREREQKQQLDEGIQQILQTHVQVANGDFSARAPLSKEHMLWQIAYSLNNLVARLQKLSMVEYEQQRIKMLVARLTKTIQLAKQKRQPLSVSRTGTYLDPLLQELTDSSSDTFNHRY